MPPVPSPPSRQSLHLRDLLPDISKLSHAIRSSDLPARASVRVTDHVASLSHLVKRQTVAIPSTYSGLNAGPKPGTVVGIVLGSVAGFLLLLWLFYTIFNGRNSSNVTVEEVQVRRRSRSPRSSRRTSTRREEVIEVSRSPAPRRQERPPPERIIVEERRAPPPVERVVVEERPPHREDDIVEVIEEHSPPPRRVRSHRRESGFRPVDADAYAGGDYPVEGVYPKRSSRRR